MERTHDARQPSPRELQALIEAERAGLPFVRWTDEEGAAHILILSRDRPRATIGRNHLSDVPLTWDREVSRAHALLEPIGEEWTLVDDGLSRNGSYVNGSRIHGRQRLHNRDRMCFGNTHVEFREPAAEGEESESTARALAAADLPPLTETQRKVLVALCRPMADSRSATPATNPQIAAEVFLSVDAVKAQLRILFERFGLAELPQNEKRQRLVTLALDSGLIPRHAF